MHPISESRGRGGREGRRKSWCVLKANKEYLLDLILSKNVQQSTGEMSGAGAERAGRTGRQNSRLQSKVPGQTSVWRQPRPEDKLRQVMSGNIAGLYKLCHLIDPSVRLQPPQRQHVPLSLHHSLLHDCSLRSRCTLSHSQEHQRAKTPV